MKFSVIIFWIVLGCAGGAVCAEQPPGDLPFEIPDAQWRPLLDRADPFLQQQLTRNLNVRGEWAQLIRKEKLAVGLVDLRDPARPRYARVNGSVMMYAASLPKIAILLAAVDAMESGRLPFDADIDEDLNAMIRTSSNAAATRMIDRLGGLARVNAVLTDPRFQFYDRNRGGGLWVGKRYAREGKRLPDPVNGISHGATVTQVARYYYRMAAGRLISKQGSTRMLAYLADPALNHKFVKALKNESPNIKLYRKSGTWKNWHADSVLVWGSDWQRYILVAMVEDPDGEKIMQRMVQVAEKTLRQPPPPVIKKPQPE